MDLSQVSDQEILGRLEKLSRTERKITHLILWHINEVRARRLYANLGYSSCHQYLVERLGYSDDSAYRREQAARVLKQVPEVAEKLENGSLNLTQLTQVQKCLRQEIKQGQSFPNAQTVQILEQLENKSNFETQKILAAEFNQAIESHEVLKPQSDESVRLEITLTADQLKTIQKAKDLLSHVLPDGNWADLFAHLANKHVQKIMGKDKDAVNLSKDQDVVLGMPDSKSSPESAISARRFMITRKDIKLTTRRQLLLKAQNCCEYVDLKSGNRCQSTYQLQVDHRVPLACGGKDEMENYRVLCRTHNLLEAQRWGILKKN